MSGPDLSQTISSIPYRMAFAGGWIDQPFVSGVNPDDVGSMVVIGLHPTVRFMDRCGMATGTRKVARKLWGESLPSGRSPEQLVKDLYAEENKHQIDPSGSQDMIGLFYPGVNRLDYSIKHEGGIFPYHIETNCDPAVAAWLEKVVNVIAVAQRPTGYSPLGEKNVSPKLAQQLGQTGKDCFNAIINRDLKALGASMNLCMATWAEMLPHVVRHPTLEVNLETLLKSYQDRYPGAMYSGCGGGYLYVVSEEPVPGAFKIKIRI